MLSPHAPLPAVPADVVPHVDVNTYLATIVWQPGVVGIVGDGAKPLPSILYSAVNPLTAGTDGKLNAALHVFAGAVITGAVGKTTTHIEELAVKPFASVAVTE